MKQTGMLNAGLSPLNLLQMSKLYVTIFLFASVREKICVILNFVTERNAKN